VQSRVEFPPTKARSWRLAWLGKPAPFELSAVVADTVVGAPQVERVSLTVAANSRDDQRREFSFDLGARLPVSQITVELPEPNSVAKLQILSRAKPGDSWRQVTEADFFRVQSGASERTNGRITIATDFDRYWLARLTPQDSAFDSAAPKLHVAWNARDLVFLASGSGPFVLACGNGSAVAAGSDLSLVPKDVSVERADLGTPRAAGGPARLQPAPRFVPWKLVTLWSTLGLGVLLLGWMTYRLSREISRAHAPKP
jgi:hypothetical protein